jgi:hypothetical protein
MNLPSLSSTVAYFPIGPSNGAGSCLVWISAQTPDTLNDTVQELSSFLKENGVTVALIRSRPLPTTFKTNNSLIIIPCDVKQQCFKLTAYKLYLCGVHPVALLTYTIQTYNIKYIYIYGPQSQLTTSLFFKSSRNLMLIRFHLRMALRGRNM